MADFFNIKARQAAAATGASSSTSKPSDSKEPAHTQPWVEKYRPKTLSDVTAQSHTITVLQRTLLTSNLPHMLFYGPPGTGKTSTILALAKQLFGPELFRSRVLELNASDERGIGIVRAKVKDFARQQLSNVPAGAAYREKYPCPPFKIVILDEADSMTQDAQSALRRTMETYSRITRFCLVCNYVTRIIDPVASRCSKFRFKALDGGDAAARVAEIADREGVSLREGAVEALVRCSEGDLRKAITFLQSAARLVGAMDGKQNGNGSGGGEEMDVDNESKTGVTVRIVEEIAGIVPDKVIRRLFGAIQEPRAGAAYEAVAKTVEEIVADGWSASQVVLQLYEWVVREETISDRHKARVFMMFSEVDKRLVDGVDEQLALMDLALKVSGVLRNE